MSLMSWLRSLGAPSTKDLCRAAVCARSKAMKQLADRQRRLDESNALAQAAIEQWQEENHRIDKTLDSLVAEGELLNQLRDDARRTIELNNIEIAVLTSQL